MTEPSPRELCILRAAAGENQTLWTRPSSPQHESDDCESPDPLAALALRAVAFLTRDHSDSDRHSLGLFVGTTTGSLRVDQEFDRSRREAHGRFASPAAFTRTLPSTIPAEISVKLNLRGPLLTLSAGDASATLALRRAAAWMHHLQLDLAVVGAIDWQFSNTDNTPTARAAFLLLSAKSASVIGHAHVGHGVAFNAAAPEDASIRALIEWVRTPKMQNLPGGVRLESVAAT